MQGAPSRGIRGLLGQLEPRDDHDRSAVRRSDVHRAARSHVGARRARARASGRAVADPRRSDRPQRRCGAGGVGRPGSARRPVDRREPGGDPSRRGPERVQADDARGRSGGAAGGRRAFPRRSADARRRDRLSGHRAAVVHARRGGSGFAHSREELADLARRSLEISPVGEILVEESIAGWKEFELEVMRDGDDNGVIVCSIENVDPMGVHTGDSVTVAPVQTLTDTEYQRMRDAALALHPRDRRRDRRFERAVRRAPARRPHGPDRDEPSGVAVDGAGVEGHRVPDREDRRPPGRGLPPGRDHERHHRRDARGVRADARLRRGEDPAVRVREVPGRPTRSSRRR